MLLFRPTLITTLTITLFLSSTVLAAPQFGRPYLHVLGQVENRNTTTTLSEDVTIISTATLGTVVITSTITSQISVETTHQAPNWSGAVKYNSAGSSRQANRDNAGIVLGSAAALVYFVL